MATYDTTGKYGLRAITGGSLANEIDDGILALRNDVRDNMAGWSSGLAASKPAAGSAGRFYRTTDTNEVWLDDGAAWQLIKASSGSSLIAPAENITLSTTAWFLMPTPDRVQNLAVRGPQDVIEVIYSGLWKSLNSNGIKATIFVGANPMSVRSLAASPGAPEFIYNYSTPNRWATLATSGRGLGTNSNNVDQTGADVTTGQLVASSMFATAPPNDIEGGGASYIQGLPAGVYDVSIRYGHTGTPQVANAKDRKLFARVLPFG